MCVDQFSWGGGSRLNLHPRQFSENDRPLIILIYLNKKTINYEDFCFIGVLWLGSWKEQSGVIACALSLQHPLRNFRCLKKTKRWVGEIVNETRHPFDDITKFIFNIILRNSYNNLIIIGLNTLVPTADPSRTSRYLNDPHSARKSSNIECNWWTKCSNNNNKMHNLEFISLIQRQ